MSDFLKHIWFPLAILPIALLGVPALIAKLSGWSDLAQRFRAMRPFQGKTWQWKSARLRAGMSYNNCLTVGSSPEGLYLAVRLIPRFSHPPLFIPWQEVSVFGEKIVFFIPMVEMRLGREEQVPFLIRKAFAAEIRAAAGARWPIETIG